MLCRYPGIALKQNFLTITSVFRKNWTDTIITNVLMCLYSSNKILSKTKLFLSYS